MKYALFLLSISLQANAAVRSVSNYDTFNVLVSIFTIIWLPYLFISMKKNGKVVGIIPARGGSKGVPKKNIRPLDQYGLNEILKLKPVMYDWKNEEKGSDNIGFIAQDVQEVIPELVNESEMLNGKEGETKLGVEYSKMVAVLTKAIQEQQKQIDELKQIINGGSK